MCLYWLLSRLGGCGGISTGRCVVASLEVATSGPPNSFMGKTRSMTSTPSCGKCVTGPDSSPCSRTDQVTGWTSHACAHGAGPLTFAGFPRQQHDGRDTTVAGTSVAWLLSTSMQCRACYLASDERAIKQFHLVCGAARTLAPPFLLNHGETLRCRATPSPRPHH